MSDSSQDIKDRLSESVRENAKHLLHLHRKVNGQPVPAQQPQHFTGGVMRWYQIEGIEWLRVSSASPAWDCGEKYVFLTICDLLANTALQNLNRLKVKLSFRDHLGLFKIVVDKTDSPRAPFSSCSRAFDVTIYASPQLRGVRNR